MKPRSGQQNGADTRQKNPQEDHEEEEVRQRTAIGPHVVHSAVLAEGESELERPTSALAYSGLAAGMSMGFSFLTEGFLRANLPSTPWALLIAKLGYSMGFLIVILGRQQLFTENTLTPMLPVFEKRKLDVLLNTLRLWGAVFLANWIGTMAFAWIVGHESIIDETMRPYFVAMGYEAMNHNFGTVLVRGIFAGWLIALLVWLLPFAEAARVWVIILMSYLIALGSFNHVVAGSVDTFYLVVMHEKTFGQYLGGFMLPTLIGNIIGGIALVAALAHAQVKSGH
ncbi:MAG TPA: formate/nitrite transporter family protein [Verrucomicrobiae bacterium]|nr:formate/nitrite transporter family protein [Verrucomicrobiae bacterium]